MVDEGLEPIEEIEEMEGAPEETTAAAEELPSMEEQLAEAEARAAENLEGWQRAVAELANARKRFNQQTQATRREAQAEAVAKLLPVLDDFDRALAAVPDAVAESDWFAGVAPVRRKLNKVLDDWNVETIDAVGQPFDPNYHEALTSEDSDEYESGVVTRELLPGYKIGERVIRPSLVYVAA